MSHEQSASLDAVPGLGTLQKLEEDLAAEWARLQDDGHGFAAVRAALEAKADSEFDDAALRAVAEAQAGFLARLDDFQRHLHTHFMAQVMCELERAMDTMRGFYGKRRMNRIERRYRRLTALAQRACELEEHYGTAQDHRRIQAVQRFYAGMVGFSERIRALDPTAPQPAGRSLVEGLYAIRRAVVLTLRRVGPASRLLVALVRAIAITVARPRPGPGTPFTNRVDDFFRALGDLRRLDVEVTGREHLADPPDPAAVRLHTPAHRHGETDNITFSHLGLPDYLVFNAIDQVQLLPKALKDRIAETPGLVAVGGGRGPAVDRAITALETGASRNVLIYPEGSVSEGFRGTRPVRDNFGEGLVRRIREAGHRVEIVPITYLDNARFLDLPPRSDTAEDRRLRVVVGPRLGDAMLGRLLRVGGGALVNQMVRLAWLEALPTDTDHLLGHDRVLAIERRLDRELDGVRYWGSLVSAPVSDRLEIDCDDPITVYEEPFRGKRVRVLQLPESAKDPSGRIALPGLRDADSSELLIGIREPSHIYLNLGSERFDGDIFRPLKRKQRDTVFPGILVRFVGVPVKSLHAIRRALEEQAGRERRTLTCAHSATKVIARAANMRIDDHADLRPFLPSHVLPTRTMRKLIERGVRNHASEPVEVQIYKTDARPLEEILTEARRAEWQIARDHLFFLTKDGWRKLRARLRRRSERAADRAPDGAPRSHDAPRD